MIKVLFVCLGNICRSPTAEAVLTQMIKNNHLSGEIHCDSSGTSAAHAGSEADPRSKQAASKKGYHITSIARKFLDSDFNRFDYIIAMDNSNYKDILQSPKAIKGKVHKFTDFCRKHSLKEGVPDPYLEDQHGFNSVVEIIEDGCFHLLDKLAREAGRD